MIIFFDNKKIWAFLCMFCIVCSFHTKYLAVELSDGEIFAKSCAVIDGYNERILYGKNARSPMANASTTKIMTCILTLENVNLNDYVLVSQNAATQPKVRLGLDVGEKYILKDLMYGLMLESFNDCAVAIAEHVAGDVENFANMMNEKAKEIGCEDTYFVTPNGLDAQSDGKEHHTTAVDLCKIMKYCVWDSPNAEDFLKITQTINYECMDPVGQMHLFVNHNQLYQSDENAISGKTGYTAKAGYCYVTAYEKDGVRFCVALLGCGWPNHRNYKWIDSQKIIDYVTEEYVVSGIRQDETIKQTEYLIFDGFYGVATIEKWGKGIRVYGVTAEEGLSTYRYMHNSVEELRMEDKYKADIVAPVTCGEVIGVTKYLLDDEMIASTDIVAVKKIYKWNLKYMMYALFLQYF